MCKEEMAGESHPKATVGAMLVCGARRLRPTQTAFLPSGPLIHLITQAIFHPCPIDVRRYARRHAGFLRDFAADFVRRRVVLPLPATRLVTLKLASSLLNLATPQRSGKRRCQQLAW